MAAAARVLAVLLALAAIAAALGTDSGAGLSVRFPAQFYVNLGTTIPLQDDPVAQSGSMYVDLLSQMIRIDNFWHGNSRTFVADMSRQRGYVVNNGECKVLHLTGKLRPYGVPTFCLKDDDVYLVRGVSVGRYTGVEHGDALQHVDYFIRNATLQTVLFNEHGEEMGASDGSGEAAKTMTYAMPWRILSRRSQRKELRAPPPKNVPNWRFFGEPMDELVQTGPFSSTLDNLVDNVPVTVDFYNFVPAAPDPHVFLPPVSCVEPPTEEFAHDVDIIVTQRLLVDLSFNTAHGRKVMERLWHRQAPAAGEPQTRDL